MTSGRPIRVGLNLLYLRPGKVGGTETYARELIAALARSGRSFECVIFANRKASPTFAEAGKDPRFAIISCGVPASPWMRHVWEQAQFPGLARRYRLDVLHSLAHVSPLRARCAKVVTIHDMIYRLAPARISWARRWFWSAMIPRSAHACDAVITPSESARQDVLALLRLAPEKVRVSPLGPGQSWPLAAPWETTKAKYNVPDSFFLSVGALPHKRIDQVRRAAQSLHQRHGVRARVLVTGSGSSSQANGDEYLHPIGQVPAAELRTLYERATAVVCTSEMEGFGLPVLEAMGAGTPVIAVKCGSLPEVAGGAGLMVADGEPAALADAMWKVAGSADAREQLRQQGRERARAFSWDTCALATLDVYDSVRRRRGEIA